MTITKFICHIFVFHITSKFGIVIAIPAHDYAWWCKVVQAVWREIPQRALLWGGVRGSGEACGGSLRGLPEVWKKRQWGAETWIGNKKVSQYCSRCRCWNSLQVHVYTYLAVATFWSSAYITAVQRTTVHAVQRVVNNSSSLRGRLGYVLLFVVALCVRFWLNSIQSMG